MTVRLSLIFLTFVVYTACTKTTSPRPVAEKFLESMQDHDYDKAAEYGTMETAKLLQQLKRIEALQAGDQVPQMGNFKIVSEEIQGKVATIYFVEEGVPEEQKITLRKVEQKNSDGKVTKEWKVSLRKEELPLPVLPEQE